MLQTLVKNAAQHTMNLEKASISNLNKALGSLEGSTLKGLDAEKIFRGEDLIEDSAASKLHTVLKEGASKGQYYDEATMQGIVRNIDAGEDAFLGVTPGAMSGSAFLNNIAGQGGAGGQAMAMLGLGVMAGGANTMMGGDFSEGAAVGALGGATVAGVARGLAKSGTNLTDDVLRKAIGDDKFVTKSDGGDVLQYETERVLKSGAEPYKTAKGDPEEFYIRGLDTEGGEAVRSADVANLADVAQRMGMDEKDLALHQFTKTIEVPDPKYPAPLNPNMKDMRPLVQQEAPSGVGIYPKNDLRAFTEQEVTIEPYKPAIISDPITSQQARQKNLDTFRNLNEEELKRANLTSAEQQAMLETDPTQKGNVAMRNRMLTLGGGMLSGVAFTSNKRDYRRGFNKRRGNRI